MGEGGLSRGRPPFARRVCGLWFERPSLRQRLSRRPTRQQLSMALLERALPPEHWLELTGQLDGGVLPGKGACPGGPPCALALSRADAVSSNRNSGAAIGVSPSSTGSVATASRAMRARSFAGMQTITCDRWRRRPDSSARLAALGRRQAAAANFCCRPVSAPASRSSSAVTQSSVPHRKIPVPRSREDVRLSRE